LAFQLVDEHAVELGTQAGGGVAVRLRGEDVSEVIREPNVSQGASIVSAVPAVREALLDMQRAAGKDGGVVLEGRDIGTVVFPSAQAKFFLTASVDVRAQRRLDELLARGATAEFEQVRR
jgi:cytidylate kinase